MGINSKENNAGLGLGGATPLGDILNSPQSPQKRQVNIGDKFNFRFHPYNGVTEITENHMIRMGEEIIEVEVKAIKKALVTFV